MHYPFKLFVHSDNNIKQFMEVYRRTGSSVTPKLHILEEHVVPWIRRWKVGVGFHSEQGAESIHTVFNSLQRTYASIRNRAQRLEGIMKEHYLRNAPENIATIPNIKRWPRKSKDQTT